MSKRSIKTTIHVSTRTEEKQIKGKHVIIQMTRKWCANSIYFPFFKGGGGKGGGISKFHSNKVSNFNTFSKKVFFFFFIYISKFHSALVVRLSYSKSTHFQKKRKHIFVYFYLIFPISITIRLSYNKVIAN
jgi:hypothetical protein